MIQFIILLIISLSMGESLTVPAVYDNVTSAIASALN